MSKDGEDVESVSGVSIPRFPGKRMEEHRMRHRREHCRMMQWLQRQPYSGSTKVCGFKYYLLFISRRVLLIADGVAGRHGFLCWNGL
jgi:hypothetical protein